LAGEWIVLVIIGIVLYKLFSGDSASKKRAKQRYQQTHPNNQYSVRQTGRNAPRSPRQTKDKTNSSYIQSAKRQEQLNNYDEASDLYLRGGQVYSAAKMKALKGPISADEAINIIRINASDQLDMITRNLVNEFYYRLDQPATAAALLRSVGYIDEAIAVEVAAGIAPQTVSVTAPAGSETSVQDETASAVVETVEEEIIPEVVVEEVPTSEPEPIAKVENVQNTLMMASVTLQDTCSVCRREIKSGDSFLQCLTCGKPGHYKHIAEMIKVTGKCPNCKQRLVMNMFDI
jgi:predicted Zn-ribbon and HTH transcriptional regulator